MEVDAVRHLCLEPLPVESRQFLFLASSFFVFGFHFVVENAAVCHGPLLCTRDLILWHPQPICTTIQLRKVRYFVKDKSLANDTLISGEQQARRRLNSNDSFSESSIYTSTLSTGVLDKFQDSPMAPGGRPFSLENLARTKIEEENSHDIESDVESSVASASALLAEHLTREEETKQEVHEESRSTKGFDPFIDDSDSSLGFSGSLANSNTSYGTPVRDMSRNSPSSTKTKRTDNLVVRVETKVVPVIEKTEQEGKEGSPVLHASDLSHSQQVAVSDIQSNTSLSNNALLRSVLENARQRERGNGGGNSRVSMKSAPSRVDHRVHKESKSRLVDHLAAHQNEEGVRYGISSRSVGVRSLVSLSENKTSKRSFSAESPSVPIYQHNSFTAPDLASPFDIYDNGSQDKVSSYSSDVGIVANRHMYTWDGGEEKASSRASSPGVLGIASISDGTPSDIEVLPDIDRLTYPWLFENGGDEPGRDHRSSGTNSISSTWSVRSNRSAGSISTDSYQSWTPKKSNAGRPPLPNGGLIDEAKLNHRSTGSRTLEHDLSRLGSVPGYRRRGTRTVMSAESLPSSSSVKSAPHSRKDKKQRLSVLAPPGKIGVVLSNRLDGRGTYISEVRPSSSLRHFVRPGDRLGT